MKADIGGIYIDNYISYVSSGSSMDLFNPL